MKTTKPALPPPSVESLIVTLRGQKVILDADLARIYGVPTRALNQAVKRNLGRFPLDFLFRATAEELDGMRSQFVIASDRSQTGTASKRNVRHLPYAFTEHGAIMAANVLNSARAVEMSVFVVRAFVKMRSAFSDSRELAQKLVLLEQELKIRLNVHEAVIVDVLQRIMKILDPPPPPPVPPPPEIGFHVKEDAVPYRTRRKRGMNYEL
ncbi:MAG: ORF6N domain-containing protein [Verrucomicrobia bacterium]|nr:ORF6N domain-containing protein [Verrucomicrobiota bacterium]